MKTKKNKERINILIKSLSNMEITFQDALVDSSVQIGDMLEIFCTIVTVDASIYPLIKHLNTSKCKTFEELKLQEIERLMKIKGLLVDDLIRLNGYEFKGELNVHI